MIALEGLPGIVEPNLALLQEAVEFVARFEAEETLELGGGQLAFAVLFQSNRFTARGRSAKESRRQFVRKIDRNLHGSSIAE